MNKRDHRQLSLEHLLEPPATPVKAPGSLDVGLRVRETLSSVLHDASDATTALRLDRFAIAAELSRLSGRDVTKNMLDRYSAPSGDDWRFPLEALPALVMATGDYRLLNLIAEACGARVIVGEEVIDARIGLIDRQMEELARTRAALKRARRRP